MKNGSQLNFPFVTIVTTPALKKGKQLVTPVLQGL